MSDDPAVTESEAGAEGAGSETDARDRFRVVLVHGDASKRALLERSLTRTPDLEVIQAGEDLLEAIELIVEELPDVACIASCDELAEAVQRITWEAPSVGIVVVEPEPDDFQALALGAFAAVPPSARDLGKIVKGVARGESVLPAAWAAQLMQAVRDLDQRVRRRVLLSETEREVMTRISEGETPMSIARDHEVTERLVNLHTGYVVAKYQRAIEAQRALLEFESLAGRT